MPALTRDQRRAMAQAVTEAMRAHYEEHGETVADFADGERYLRDDADDEELNYEYQKWVLNTQGE